MSSLQLVADSGATKTAWCLFGGDTRLEFTTAGLNPYYYSGNEITELLQEAFPPAVKEARINAVHFYGSGCGDPQNQQYIRESIGRVLAACGEIAVDTDMVGAAKAACGHQPGVVGILGTGSNSCVFDGHTVVKNNPAPGFLLGDEGSGAMLGKKVLQYFIYHTFDDELQHRFTDKYKLAYTDILAKVYRQPHPNRFLASFAPFLSENRGHYMVENIIEDGFSEFFYNHLYKYPETWTHPLHFCGSIAHAFSDVIADICESSELQLGRILQQPLDGLVAYHEQ